MLNTEIVIADPSSFGTTWEFLDGSKRSAVNLSSSFVGIGTYQPGWRWSEHVGRQTGKPSENHIGYILSGSLTVKSASGDESVIRPGEAFELAPGHDAWVNGSEPCVALDFGFNRKHDVQNHS